MNIDNLFMAKVRKCDSTGCWLWHGSLDGGGYGKLCRGHNGQGWAIDVYDGRRAWTKTHLGESPLNKAEAHRLAHKLRDPKFYTARTKRAVNSLTIERGPKAVPHE